MADHYSVLGLPKFTPTPEEIKKSFRKLAIKWHPDKCKAPNANDVFSRISTAYETLYDADSRLVYDRSLRSSGMAMPASASASSGHAAARNQAHPSSTSSSSERFKQHMSKNRFKQRRKHNYEYSRKHTSGFDQWHYDYRQRQQAHRSRSRGSSSSSQRSDSEDSSCYSSRSSSRASSRASSAGSETARVASAFASVFGGGDFEKAANHWDNMMDQLLVPMKKRNVIKLQRLWRGYAVRKKYSRHIKHIKKVLAARKREKKVQEEAARRVKADAARRLREDREKEIRLEAKRKRDAEAKRVLREKREAEEKEKRDKEERDRIRREHWKQLEKQRSKREMENRRKKKLLRKQSMEQDSHGARHDDKKTKITEEQQIKHVLEEHENRRKATKQNHEQKLKSIERLQKERLTRFKTKARDQAATRIQSIVRSFLAKRHVSMLRAFSVRLAHKMRELEKERRNASAVIIQHNFRRYRTNTIVQQKLKSRKLILQSIVYMQSLMRKKIASKYVESRREKSAAARKIQYIARAHLHMRAAALAEERLRHNAATKLQSLARGKRDRKHLLYLKQVVRLQCWSRQYLSKHLLLTKRRERSRLNTHATVIQKYVRRLLAINAYVSKRRWNGALVLQNSLYRRWKAKQALKILRYHRRLVQKVIKVQSIYRKRKAYRKALSVRIDALLEKRHDASLKIQSMVRMHLQVRKYKKQLDAARQAEIERLRELERHKSAVLLQSYVRMKLAKVLVHEVQLDRRQKQENAKRNAAIKIQNSVRMVLAKGHLKQLRDAHKRLVLTSATKIQSIVRMKLNRIEFLRTKEKRMTLCATRIQSLYRMHRCKMALENAALLRKQQLVASGFEFTLHSYLVKLKAVKMAKRLLSHIQQRKENDAAVRIQSLIRQRLALQLVQRLKKQKEEEEELQRQEEERARKKQQVLLRTQKAIKIQSIARVFLARRTLLALYMAKYNRQRRNASITIQGMYRTCIARRRLNALKLERDNNASIVIQCFQRRISAMRKMDSLLLEHLEHINAKATRIQTCVRRYLGMCLLADMQFEQNVHAATTIQSYVRRHLAQCAAFRKRVARRDKELYEASVKIQCMVRCAMAKNMLTKLRTKRAELAAQQRRAQEALAMIKSGRKWGRARKQLSDRGKSSERPRPAWGINMDNSKLGATFSGITPTRPPSMHSIQSGGAALRGKSPRKVKLNQTRRGESTERPLKKYQSVNNSTVLPKIKRRVMGSGASKSAPAAMQTHARTKLIATSKLKLHNKKAQNVGTSVNKRKSRRQRMNGGRVIRNGAGGGQSISQQNSAVNWFSQ